MTQHLFIFHAASCLSLCHADSAFYHLPSVSESSYDYSAESYLVTQHLEDILTRKKNTLSLLTFSRAIWPATACLRPSLWLSLLVTEIIPISSEINCPGVVRCIPSGQSDFDNHFCHLAHANTCQSLMTPDNLLKVSAFDLSRHSLNIKVCVILTHNT